MGLPTACPAVDLDRVAVVFVSFIISWLPVSSQIFVVYDYLGGWTARTVSHLAAFNFVIGLLWFNYYKAVTTDPGKIPDGWIPPYLQPSQAGQEASAGLDKAQTDDTKEFVEVGKSSLRPRFCRTCKQYKPPRSHHCSSCGRCVLRMDHHCPWVGNCVGHYNYQHFIRFLLCVNVGATWCFGLLCARVVELFRALQTGDTWYRVRQPEKEEVIILIVNMIALVPIILSVGMLSMYQLYCVSCNTTTIESWEKEKVATMVRRGKISEVKFPYDLGIFRNIQAVLGKNPLLWWWPQSMKTDGLSYPVSDKLKDEKSPFDAEGTTEIQWPPPEYDKERMREKRPPAYMRQQNRQKQSQHVRRGSEGYIVRDISSKDREAMVKHELQHASRHPPPDSEDDDDDYNDPYDSFSDFEESESDDDLGYRTSDDEAAQSSSDYTLPRQTRAAEYQPTDRFFEWERRQRLAQERRHATNSDGATVSSGLETHIRSRSPKKSTSSHLTAASDGEGDDEVPLARLMSPIN